MTGELITVGTPGLWAAFIAFVLAMLALDLGVFHRKAHSVGVKEALGWSVVWVAMSLAFNGWVYWRFGPQAGMEFLTGYLVEKSLAVDNVFVWMVVFSAFAVPPIYQHRVLFWGVVGALVMRAIFIFAGAALIARFHWVLYLFGGILVVTGLKLMIRSDSEVHPERNPVVRLFQKWVPSTPQYHGQRFWVRENGKWLATPLVLALVTVEVTDLVFAVDSIPAIFAITQDPFIVFTSNIFAILGLRAMFFLLAGVINKFAYLKYGLALVLCFVGGKMLAVDFYKIPTPISLGVIIGLLGGSMAYSLWRTRREVPQPAVAVTGGDPSA